MALPPETMPPETMPPPGAPSAVAPVPEAAPEAAAAPPEAAAPPLPPRNDQWEHLVISVPRTHPDSIQTHDA